MAKTKSFDIESASALQFVFITFIPLINYIVGVWLGSGGLWVTLILVLSLSVYKLIKRQTFKVNPSWMLYFLVLLLYGLFSEHSSLNALQMILYVFLPAVVAASKIDMRKFLRFSTFSAFSIALVLPVLIRDLSNEGVRQTSLNGISYAVLPVFVAGLFHFAFFGKEDKSILTRICYIIDIVLGILLIINANRGVVLSLVIAVFATIIFNQKEYITIRRGFTIAILFIASILAAFNFQRMMLFLYDTFSNFGIKLSFVNKFALLNQMNDISNGRNSIGDYVLAHLGESFIWGHGLSTIYYNSGKRIVYPHNMILQLLYDGGLILSIPVILLLVFMVIYLFQGKDLNKRVLILFFTVVCIPKMMLSSDVWINPAFWLFVFAMFNHSGNNLDNENVIAVNQSVREN